MFYYFNSETGFLEHPRTKTGWIMYGSYQFSRMVVVWKAATVLSLQGTCAVEYSATLRLTAYTEMRDILLEDSTINAGGNDSIN